MSARLKHLRDTYKMTGEQFDAMMSNQSGRCAICKGEPPESRYLHVDHCHATGKVRALLCNRCNSMLGNARDSAEILQSGIAYLARHA